MPATVPRYSRPQMILHWFTLAALAVSFFSSGMMEAAWRELMRAGGDFVSPGPNLHSMIGFLVLVVTAIRIGMRLVLGAPAAEASWPRWMVIASQAVHGLLYVALIAMPVTGILAWIVGITGAAMLHGLIWNLLLLLIAAHVGAALWHQFVLKDNLLARMR